MCDLKENKREMFDGMRAYHASEISHASHAITMLLAISGAAGAVVLALLFPKTPPNYISQMAWGLFIVISVFAIAVAWTAHLKISGDHEVYKSFGREYVKTSILLGFFDKDVTIDSKSEKLKTNEAIGQGEGYKKTQTIIWSFAIVLIIFTFLFACFLPCII